MPRVEQTLLAARLRRIASEEARTDAELAGRYAEYRDAAAFEVLVWRHGPMVWATCRRVLRHQQDAEDAFQAAFLALARAAGTLGSRQAVAGWLHRVAMNLALNMKARRRSSGLTGDVPAPSAPDRELFGAVDEELERLPNRMRAAFVLCCLEGMTSAEAARELGCPVGTVDSRLHAARTRLRDRLTRRGLGPPAVLVGATGTAASATAALPAHWVQTVLRHATVPGAVPNNINLLATGALKSMSASTPKVVAALLFVGGVLLIGGGFVLAQLNGRPDEPPRTPGIPKGVPNAVADPDPLPDDWSKPVNGLQARVVLVEKPRSNGTRMLHPYLELRNVDNMAYPLKVRLGGARHVKFELVDEDGKVVDDGQKGARDGHYPDPGTIALPLDSSLRVGMFCTNWGGPRDAAAMIATDSGCWVLRPEQEGKVFLRVKVSGTKQDDERVWFGNLEAKTKVTWSGEAPLPIPTAWGKPVRGLQAGIRISPEPRLATSVVSLEVVVRNVSKEVITFDHLQLAIKGAHSEGTVTATCVEVGGGFFPVGSRFKAKLAPGESHQLVKAPIFRDGEGGGWVLPTPKVRTGENRIGVEGLAVRLAGTNDVELATGYLDVQITPAKK